MPEIRESGALKAQDSTGATMQLTVITPGQGSSGTYTEAVLKTAGEDKVWPKGTLCFADHPSESERFDRPERSIRDLAGVLTEDAYWNGSALVAEVKTFDPWTAVLGQMSDAIGVSIRAEGSYEESTTGGPPTIAKLTRGISVDFVTQAGRGGAIRQVYESARASAPLLVRDDTPRLPRTARQVVEALPGGLTANALRSALSAAVDDAYRSPGDADGNGYAYAWVSDWTDTWVVFSISGQGDNAGLWQQGYTVADSAVTLTGTKSAVMVQKTYVPAPAGAATPGADGDLDEATSPAALCDAALHRELTEARTSKPPSPPAGSTTTHSRKGTRMPEIEEGALRKLEEAEQRLPIVEAERDTLKAQLAEAVRGKAVAEAGEYARAFARKQVVEANAELPAAVVDKIVRESTREVPLGEDLRLDTEALTKTVDEARKAEESYLALIAQESGIGSVRGVGAHQTGGALMTESEREQRLNGVFA